MDSECDNDKADEEVFSITSQSSEGAMEVGDTFSSQQTGEISSGENSRISSRGPSRASSSSEVGFDDPDPESRRRSASGDNLFLPSRSDESNLPVPPPLRRTK